MALLTKMVFEKWESKFVCTSFEFVVIFNASSVQFLASERFPSSLWHYSTTKPLLFTLISKLHWTLILFQRTNLGFWCEVWTSNYCMSNVLKKKNPWKWTHRAELKMAAKKEHFFDYINAWNIKVCHFKIIIFLMLMMNVFLELPWRCTAAQSWRHPDWVPLPSKQIEQTAHSVCKDKNRITAGESHIVHKLCFTIF